jgi:hypothetical protein
MTSALIIRSRQAETPNTTKLAAQTGQIVTLLRAFDAKAK